MMLQTCGSDVARHISARTCKARELLDDGKANFLIHKAKKINPCRSPKMDLILIKLNIRCSLVCSGGGLRDFLFRALLHIRQNMYDLHTTPHTSR
jgi:hypothetical protein